MKELEEEWSKLDPVPPKPTRLTRSQQEKKAQMPAAEESMTEGDVVEEGNQTILVCWEQHSPNL